MKLYNSISKQVEQFVPLKEKEVTMYFCGPTTYNYAHIGNARPALVADLLWNVLLASGYEVKYASNYTDIDDRIVVKALAENKDALAVSQFYIDAYRQDLDSLFVKKPMFTPKVSDTMESIIHFIEDLVAKGYAYEVDGDVYFAMENVEKYGLISHQKLEELQVGARIEENLAKRNPLDFALWKKSTSGKAWESRFSLGRPGWHSECVVMINEVFKQSLIDIHGGGSDLKFPHHENEVVQSCALHDTILANYWVHNGMIKVDGNKMSKSLGNVFFIKDLVNQYGGNVIRWFILRAPYRQELSLNTTTLESAKAEIDKLSLAYKQLQIALRRKQVAVGTTLDEAYELFLAALQDDLNTQNAQTVLFDFVKKINQSLRQKELDVVLLQNYEYTLEQMLVLLGLELPKVVLMQVDLKLFDDWEKAKRNKDFEQADMYRKMLIEKGYL